MTTMITVQDAAQRLRVGPNRVMQLCRDNRLVGQKSGSEWEIDPDSVELYLKTRQRGGPRIRGKKKDNQAPGPREPVTAIVPEVSSSNTDRAQRDRIGNTDRNLELDRESVILRLLDALDDEKRINAGIRAQVTILQTDVARLTKELDEATQPQAKTSLTEKEAAALTTRAADLFPELARNNRQPRS